MNDHCTRLTQQLVKTDIGSLQRIDVESESEMECVSQPRPVSEEVGGGWSGAIAFPAEWWHHFSKRTRSWQVNWNHHWCYLFSNAPRLTGDILFGTHPKGGRGAQRFSAPSRADSSSVLTPKQWDSLETCSGICHNPAPHEENTNAHILICRTARLPPRRLNTTLENKIVCPPKKRKSVEDYILFLVFVLDNYQQKCNQWKRSVMQMPKLRRLSDLETRYVTHGKWEVNEAKSNLCKSLWLLVIVRNWIFIQILTNDK